MNFGELDKLCRREIDDEKGSDSQRRVQSWQMLAYANEAENEACRRARLLIDSVTADICTIPVVAGTSVYAYDPRIIFIRRARLLTAARVLKKAVYWELDEQFPSWDEKTGTVEAVVTGMDTGKIRLFRIPTANDTLKLTAVRLPLTPMTESASTPEINTRFHPALVYWMKHKVYNNQDSELFDKNRADIHLALFAQEFGDKSAAVNEVFDEMNLPFDSSDGHY
jgi:hypothetical protein